MFYVGVDLGQRYDPAAIAVVEQAQAMHAWMLPYDQRLGVRHLERMPLGTPYTAVARRIQDVVWKLNGNCCVAVDATGLGAPVIDVLREAQLPCELAPVVTSSPPASAKTTLAASGTSPNRT